MFFEPAFFGTLSWPIDIRTSAPPVAYLRLMYEYHAVFFFFFAEKNNPWVIIFKIWGACSCSLLGMVSCSDFGCSSLMTKWKTANTGTRTYRATAAGGLWITTAKSEERWPAFL
jgi:hypothetical protein